MNGPARTAPGTAPTAGAVNVLVCGDERGHAALRWAAAEARRRRLPLEVLVTAHTPAGPPQRRPAFVRALAAVRAAMPGLTMAARAASGETVDALRRRSVGAAALVVPADLPEITDVVAQSWCPVVAVPERPTTPGEPVVVGVAPWTSEGTIDLAFTEADARRTRLIAVRAWDEPAVDLGWLRPDRIARWDRAEQHARSELEMALSAERIVHPDVPVELVVVQDDPAEMLLALSGRAQLVVLGRSARGALLANLAGSPVDALLRAARCPVIVVPAEGPAMPRWLPSRERGWALSAGP